MPSVTFITKPDCDHCADVRSMVDSVLAEYPATLEEVDATSERGRELVLTHGLMASPGILVDDRFVGMGNVSREDLINALTK